MFMVKCLIKLQNCIMRDVWCNPNSTSPMSFATLEDATKFAEQNILNKKFENIGNSNSVFGFQVVPFSTTPFKSELVG